MTNLNMTPEQITADNYYRSQIRPLFAHLNNMVSGGSGPTEEPKGAHNTFLQMSRTLPHAVKTKLEDGITEEEVKAKANKYNLDYIGIEYNEDEECFYAFIFGVDSNDFDKFTNEVYWLYVKGS